jgi:hypothetical protein
MGASDRELTHPSWRRAVDDRIPPHESLMSQMVRAQLIFDRRTPAEGLPAWGGGAGDVAPLHLDAMVGLGAGEFLVPEAGESGAEPQIVTDEQPMPFAQELAERLHLARERVDAEHQHLAQVGTVAASYLGRPKLRLLK